MLANGNLMAPKLSSLTMLALRLTMSFALESRKSNSLKNIGL
jgi:hypothetical protein